MDICQTNRRMATSRPDVAGSTPAPAVHGLEMRAFVDHARMPVVEDGWSMFMRRVRPRTLFLNHFWQALTRHKHRPIWEITLKTKEAAGRYAVRLSCATAGSTSGSRTFRKEAR